MMKTVNHIRLTPDDMEEVIPIPHLNLRGIIEDACYRPKRASLLTVLLPCGGLPKPKMPFLRQYRRSRTRLNRSSAPHSRCQQRTHEGRYRPDGAAVHL